MFTGLIQATGTVVSLGAPSGDGGPISIVISTPALAPMLRMGDSIAVSGVCLTALDISLTQFRADLAQETVQRTTLAGLRPGSVVNLELPTPAGSPLGGHVVQGHVDGTGVLLALDPIDASSEATTDWRLRVAVPPELTRYVAPQGSITIDGISLTVAGLLGDVVSVAIIPHTYLATSLRTLQPNTPVNIETDALAKYAERQSAGRAAQHGVEQEQGSAWELTEAYLLANGY